MEEQKQETEKCEEDNKVTPEYDYTLPPIGLDINNILKTKFNKDNFQKGLDDISYVCGEFTGLVNAGIDPADAMGYILNREIMANTLEVGELNKEASIGVAKENAVNVEKNTI